MTRYLTLALVWAIWCALHSLMISPPITGFIARRLPGLVRYYRLLFNAVALGTLIGVVGYGAAFQGPVIFGWNGWLRIVQTILLAAAIGLFAAGARRYDLRQFLGLRQARSENTCHVLTDDCHLDTQGVLGLVRHPWYSGGILLIWARQLDAAAVVTNLVLTLYFIVGAMIEEEKLRAQFGAEYEAYRRRVSMLVPIRWVQRGFRRSSGKP